GGFVLCGPRPQPPAGAGGAPLPRGGFFASPPLSLTPILFDRVRTVAVMPAAVSVPQFRATASKMLVLTDEVPVVFCRLIGRLVLYFYFLHWWRPQCSIAARTEVQTTASIVARPRVSISPDAPVPP